MNIWLVVILIVAVALVLGPVMLLRPRPGQKKKEQLRLNARALGLHFSMRSLPKLTTSTENPGVIPVYCLPPNPAKGEIVPWSLVRTAYAHEGNFYEEWDWQGEARPAVPVQTLLRQWMPRLPIGVQVVSSGNEGVCIYWDEKAGEAELASLVELLEQLQNS